MCHFCYYESHMSGKIYTFKNKFLQENNFFHRKKIPIVYLEFPAGVKDFPIGI